MKKATLKSNNLLLAGKTKSYKSKRKFENGKK